MPSQRRVPCTGRTNRRPVSADSGLPVAAAIAASTPGTSGPAAGGTGATVASVAAEPEGDGIAELGRGGAAGAPTAADAAATDLAARTPPPPPNVCRKTVVYEQLSGDQDRIRLSGR
jgi:hypothetical protein